MARTVTPGLSLSFAAARTCPICHAAPGRRCRDLRPERRHRALVRPHPERRNIQPAHTPEGATA